MQRPLLLIGVALLLVSIFGYFLTGSLLVAIALLVPGIPPI